MLGLLSCPFNVVAFAVVATVAPLHFAQAQSGPYAAYDKCLSDGAASGRYQASDPESVSRLVDACERSRLAVPGACRDSALGTCGQRDAAWRAIQDEDAKKTSSEFPLLDVDSHCAKFPQESQRTCLNKEQAAYDYLRSQWSRLHESTKKQCLSLLKTARSMYPYGFIEECIDRFEPIARRQDEQKLPVPTFRY